VVHEINRAAKPKTPALIRASQDEDIDKVEFEVDMDKLTHDEMNLLKD
jgi:hypothetical protein